VSTTQSTFDLRQHGLTVTEVHHNLSPSALYEHAIRFGPRGEALDERGEQRPTRHCGRPSRRVSV